MQIEEFKKRINCNSSSKVKTFNGLRYTINLTDFDVQGIELQMDKYNNNVNIKGEIIETEFDSSINKYSKWGIVKNSVSLSINHRSYLKVYYNGIKYLMALAKSQIPKEEIEVIEDPFVLKKSQSISKNGNSPSKVILKKENGVTSLSVTVGGKITSKFILDSGAGECNISSELEKKLIANGIIKKTDYLVNGLYKLADGSIVENRRVKIPKMKIGNKTVSNVIVSIGTSDSPNLLGQSFLNKLDKWSIDNSKKTLIVE